MTIQILMPALSPTMTDGKLSRWLKKEGDAVASGDLIVEIETDKATMEIEAVEDGILGKILVAEGTEGVAVNTPIAVILEEGEDQAAAEAAIEAAAAMPQPEPQPEPQAAPPAAAQPEPQAKPQPAPQTAPPKAAGARIIASPIAFRLAAEGGLDIAAVAGSGPHGRIVKSDVEAALAAGATGTGSTPAAAPAAPARPTLPAVAAPGAAAPGAYTEVAHTTMRKIIAERLSQSSRDIPHFHLSVDCRIDRLVDLRKELNRRAAEDDAAPKISVNDFVIRAVALALRKVPAANASWTDTAIRLYTDIDIAIAVATEGGLITPIIRQADFKGLADISNEIKYLAERARTGQLTPEEYQGGGFTISNLGMYGVRQFSAIINPPQACILAVGAAEQRPAVVDGALGLGTMMSCTLGVDHRAVDGALGAQFLAAFKGLIEDPLTMLL